MSAVQMTLPDNYHKFTPVHTQAAATGVKELYSCNELQRKKELCRLALLFEMILTYKESSVNWLFDSRQAGK